MTNDKKQQFIGKWSKWFIYHKLEEFERELDELIADEREKMKDEIQTEKALNGITPDWIANKVQHTGMTEAEFEKAKAGATIEHIDGSQSRLICCDADGTYPIIVLKKVEKDDVPYRHSKEIFMQNFRLRTTKREGWVALRKGEYGMCVNGAIIEVEDVFDSIWGDKDFIKAHVTWEE